MNLEPLDKCGETLLMPQDEKARRRSNTAPSGNPGIAAEELAQGVTLERLQSLPVPVYAYQTQLTIHGQFPPVSGLCAGYKLLTRNANGSLGVRYAGIDAGKKQIMARALRLAGSPWSPFRDSRGLTLQRCVASASEGRELIAGIPSGIYGGAGLFRCPLSGRIYAIVSVGAIRAADLWNVIGYFAPGMTAEKMQRKEEEIEREQAEREKQRQAERAERAANAEATLETLRAKLVEKGEKPLPPSFTPKKGDSFRVLKMRLDGQPALITYTLAMRGPVLCIVREGQKGRKVTPENLESWRKSAIAGRVFSVERVAE
jgi:hypothetical protein